MIDVHDAAHTHLTTRSSDKTNVSEERVLYNALGGIFCVVDNGGSRRSDSSPVPFTLQILYLSGLHNSLAISST